MVSTVDLSSEGRPALALLARRKSESPAGFLERLNRGCH
jgi:hypothetical protein